jgi:hypothetical protein
MQDAQLVFGLDLEMAEREGVLEPLQVKVDVQADLDLVDWNRKRVGHDAPRNVDTCGGSLQDRKYQLPPFRSRNICFHTEFVTRSTGNGTF